MYNKIVLENGVRILFEEIPYVRSVSAGIWVGTGSRYEKASENGASHFIEHMVFKGTENRSAGDIASETDGIGGQINAFTTKECTCFYGKVLDTHLRLLLDILGDMFFNSKFDDNDVANERGVIFEEIDMYEDTPDDLVSERMFSSVFKGSPLSRPILGTKRTLKDMTGTFLKEYINAHYTPKNTVIAVSGNFKMSDIDYIKSIFCSMKTRPEISVKCASYTPAFTTKRKSIEQNHLCIGFPGVSITSNDRFTMQLLSSILGGGMSSRLFQTVREKNGLCYSIFSFGASHADTGLFAIYTALNPECEERAIGLILDEIHKFKADGITQDELIRAREQVKANVLMSLESTGARMNRLGKGALFFDRIPDIDEVVAKYDAVTTNDIAALAQKYLDFSQISFSGVGRVSKTEKYQDLLTK